MKFDKTKYTCLYVYVAEGVGEVPLLALSQEGVAGRTVNVVMVDVSGTKTDNDIEIDLRIQVYG